MEPLYSPPFDLLKQKRAGLLKILGAQKEIHPQKVDEVGKALHRPPPIPASVEVGGQAGIVRAAELKPPAPGGEGQPNTGGSAARGLRGQGGLLPPLAGKIVLGAEEYEKGNKEGHGAASRGSEDSNRPQDARP